MANLAEVKKYTRVMLPVLGLLVLSACSATDAQEPTVDQIKASIPKPSITLGTDRVYTKNPSTSFTVDWTNLYGSNSPDISISPNGPNLTWVNSDWYNPFSKKNKLQVDNLTDPNREYQITLSGENCTKYKEKLICTDMVQKTIDLIYDTIAPTAQVTGFESQDGRLIIHSRNSDNLSGPKEDTQDFVINNPQIGDNSISVNICDNADNCQNQSLTGKYDPFKRVINMERANLEDSGKIVIAGHINDPAGNIDLGQTQIKVKQDMQFGPIGIPDMAFDLNKKTLQCDDVKFSGYDFVTTCTPVAREGKSEFTLTITDKAGNKYTERYQVEIPPLAQNKVNLFYTLLAASFITSSGLLAKVEGDRVMRNRRLDLIGAIKSRNDEAITEASSRLVKRDRKKYPDLMQDYDSFKSAEEAFYQENYIDTVRKLKEIFKKKNPFLKEVAEELLAKAVSKINSSIGKIEVTGFKKGRPAELVDFLTNTFFNSNEYGFFWEVVSKSLILRDNLFAAIMTHLMEGKAIRRKEFVAMGWSEQANLRAGITLLVSRWKNYRLILENLDRLVSTEGKTGKPGLITQSVYDSVRPIIDSEEEVVWRSIEQKMQKIPDIIDLSERTIKLEEIKKQLSQVGLYLRHSQFIEAGIQYREREMLVLQKIEDKKKQIIELAVQSGVPAKGFLMTKFNERIMSDIKNTAIISMLVNKDQDEIDAFMDAFILIHLTPLGFFVGAKDVKMASGLFQVDKIPPPDKKDLALYHSEGQLARKYSDPVFTVLLNEVYNRLTQDYNFCQKNHKSGKGKPISYELYIPVHDAGLYGEKELDFYKKYLQILLINIIIGSPMHREIIRFAETKLHLVAK